MAMYQTMEELRGVVSECRACRLYQTRHNVVFGVGNEGARVLFVGEAPGENEDLQGEPFVGLAGQLLDKMLLAAEFSRKDNIYITNMVKCRPPGNRDPQKDEMDACKGFLRNQFKLIGPQIIVCLGRVAAQGIMDPEFRVTRQHGQFVQRGSTLMMGTYHPAALLRNPASKPEAFGDLLALRDRLSQL